MERYPAAILSADIVDFLRPVGEDETGTQWS